VVAWQEAIHALYDVSAVVRMRNNENVRKINNRTRQANGYESSLKVILVASLEKAYADQAVAHHHQRRSETVLLCLDGRIAAASTPTCQPHVSSLEGGNRSVVVEKLDSCSMTLQR
jgi:hypothetical protein